MVFVLNPLLRLVEDPSGTNVMNASDASLFLTRIACIFCLLWVMNW